MKKRSIFAILLVLLLSFSVFACSKGKEKPEFGDYGYTGDVNYEIMTVDEGITLDGELTEDIWADCPNTLTAVSTDTFHPYDDQGTLKWMDVHTYFGENGIYVAFEVYDNGIFFNEKRRQTRNTGVELYFSTIDVSQLNSDVMSIRVSPTGDTLNPLISFWRGNGDDYTESKSLGDYLAAAKIDGTLNEGDLDDTGYVVELAISYDLFGGPIDIYQYTAAFVQMANARDDIRYANSFIQGTGHNRPTTFKAVTNDGVIADKYAEIDKTVTWDEGIEMDGQLTEDFWVDAIQNNKGMDWTQTSTNISLNIYTHMTDLGLYIGLDSNDKDVYYNANRVAKYNTGAEIFIAPMGETSVTTNAKQVRFNVGGSGEKWVGSGTSNAWMQGYFLSKSAGFVKGEGATLNSSNTDGWSGEIFIPWSELGVTNAADKTRIAIQANMYHSPSDAYWDNVNNNAAAYAAGWAYMAPYGANTTQHNPQECYFLFTKEAGYVFNKLTVRNTTLDRENFTSGADVIANNPDLTGIDGEKDYYFVDTTAQVVSAGVLSSRGFTTSKLADPSGTLAGEDGEEYLYEHLGNGEFRLYFEKSDETLSQFGDNKKLVYTNAIGGTATFNINYDASMAVNGKINANDEIIAPLFADMENKVAIISNKLAGASDYHVVTVATGEKAMYLTSMIINAGVDSKFNASKAIYYVALGDLAIEGILKVEIDLATGENVTYLYDGYDWEQVDYSDYVITGVGNEAETGYVVEMRIAWDALGGEAKEYVRVASVMGYSNNVEILGEFRRVFEDDELEMSNYLRFTDGFAPDAAYALNEIVFVEGEATQTVETKEVYERELTFSYLGRGGVVTNMDYMTVDTTATVQVEKATVEAIQTDYVHTVEDVLGLTSDVTVYYVKPNADRFQKEYLEAYLNFDYGAENLVANEYTDYLVENKSGEAFIAGADYEGDKYFNANMKQRSVKIPTTLGNGNFTVSMMVNGDELKKYPTNTYSFVLFGTGNVDNGAEGFTVRMRSDAFQIRTSSGYDGDVPFDMSKLNGWTRLTFAFRSVTGGVSVYTFVDHQLVSEKAISADLLDVNAYRTLGIGGPGSVRDTETGYLDINIGIDDVALYKAANVLNVNAIYDMIAYLDQINEAANFGIEAVDSFDYNFNHFASSASASNSLTVTNVAGGNVTLGGAWATYAEAEGNQISYNLNKEDAEEVSASVSYYQVGDFKKYVQFKFSDLSEVSLDVEEVSVWKKNKNGNVYTFNVSATSEGTGIENNLGLIFKVEDVTLEASHIGGGTYTVSVPDTLIESLTDGSLLTVTASIDGNSAIATDSFAVEFKHLTNVQVMDLAQNVEALLDFENETAVNAMNGEAATYTFGTPQFDDGAYVANMRQRALAVDGITIGDTSFTVSALINGADLKANTITGGGHATMLFGTSDVDATTGLSVRIKRDGCIQVKINGSYWLNTIGFVNLSTISDDYSRWTFVFNRETPGFMTLDLYINMTKVKTFTAAAPQAGTLDRVGFSKLGIGAGPEAANGNYGGDRGTGDIRFGDFILYRGVLNENMLEGIDSYFDEISENGAWYVEDVAITYEHVTGTQTITYPLNLIQTGNLSVTDVTVEGLPSGITLDNSGNLVIPYASLNALRTPVVATATINGISKSFTLAYYPLEAIYAEKTEVAMWSDEKTGNNYEFTTKIFVDAAKTLAINGNVVNVTFKIGATELTKAATANAGEYRVSIPANLVEGMTAQTITVSTGMTDVDDAVITFTHKHLDSATIERLVANTQSYLSFEDTLKDVAHETRMGTMYLGSSVTYENGVDGKAVKLNPKNTSVKLDGVTLGADSFTVSFDANISETNFASINGNYNEFVSSLNQDTTVAGNTYDYAPSTFQMVYRANHSNVTNVRNQIGRNGDETHYMAAGKLAAGKWQRHTLVVERDVEYDAAHTKAVNNYNASGTYANGKKENFSAPEKVRFTLYIDGIQVFQEYNWFSENQYIGSDALYLGGMYGKISPSGNIKDNSFLMDNFVVYNGAMTADEVRGMTSANSNYYAQIGETYGVDVEDVNIDFSHVQGANSYAVQLNLYAFGMTDVSGATLVEEEGFTLTEEGGVYTLHLDETGLEKAQSVQTLTMKWGETERTFTVVYAPLTALYAEKANVDMWTDQKGDNEYSFEIGIYADESKLVPITDSMGITIEFEGVEGMTATYDSLTKKYDVTLPAAQVENQAARTITVSVTGEDNVTAATFNFVHNYFDGSKLEEMMNNTEAYLAFDDSIVNLASSRETSMALGTATYVDGVDGKAIRLNPVSNVVKLNDILPGTTSYTISFDLNVDAGGNITSLNNYYELVASKNFDTALSASSRDMHPSSFQLSYRGGQNRMRFQAGRNDGQNAQYLTSTSDKIANNTVMKPGTWQRITIVVERGVETISDHMTTTTAKYDTDGNYDANAPTTDKSYATPEKARWTLYIDGIKFEEKTTYYSEGQSIGFGDLYLGGDHAVFYQNAGNNHDMSMDNFLFYRGAMTAYEVRGLSSVNTNYYQALAQKGGVAVADLNLDFTKVQGATSYTSELEVINLGKNSTGGGTLVSAPTGFTLNEADGAYTLTLDADALALAEGGQKLTIDFGDVQRTFTVTYVPLNALYVDAAKKELWSIDAAGDVYEFEVGVYADSEKTIAITDQMGVTITVSGIDGATAAWNGEKYDVTIPKTSINDETKNLVFGVSGDDGIQTASVAVTHYELTEEEQQALAANMTHYYDFNGSVVNQVDGQKAKFIFGNAQGEIADPEAYADGNTAYVSNVTSRYMLAQGVTLGTSSFTVSMLVNVDDLRVNSKWQGNSGRATGMFGTSDIDNGIGLNVASSTGYPINGINEGTLRVRINGSNMSMKGNLDYSGSGYERLTFVFDRATSGTLTVTVYQQGRVVSSGTTTLAADATLDYTFTEKGDGKEGCASANTAGTNGGFGIGNGGVYDGVANNLRGTGDIRYSDFMIFNTALSYEQAVGLVNDGFGAMVEKYDLRASDLTIYSGDVDFADGNVYTVQNAITALSDYNVNTGVKFTESYEGVTLVDNGDGSYNLTFTQEALSAITGEGGTKTFSVARYEDEIAVTDVKTFTVTYEALDALYVTSVVSLYEFEKNVDDSDFANGYVYRDVKVTSDEAGNNGVENAIFNGGVEVVKANGGVYTLKIPYETASYTVGHSAAATTVDMNVTLDSTAAIIVKDTDGPTKVNTKSTYGSSPVQGGKVYNVGDSAFGTDSFSLSVMVENISLTASGGNGAFFTNSNVDAHNGFVFYANSDRWRFRAGNNAAPATSKDVNMSISSRMTGWHHLLVTFDRSGTDTVVYTVWIDGQNWGTATFSIPSTKSFDVTDGHLVIGSANVSYTQGGTCNAGADGTSYTLAGAVVTKGIIDVEAATQYVKHNVYPTIGSYINLYE